MNLLISFFLFFLLSITFHLTTAQRNPSISFISKDKVVNIGDQLELKCQVQDAGNYPVQWSKLGSPQVTLSTSQTIVTPSTRHHIRYDDRDSTYTLLIDKVQEIDAGTYRCEISIGASNYHLKSSFTADTPVIVRIQPVISDNSTRSVITTAGSRVDLQCYGAGYPQPIISWRREKHRLLPNNMAFFKGNTLTIGNVSKDDRGTYYCVADNGVGSGARRHIGVEVEFAPYVWSIQPKVEQAMQYDADLHCRIEAFPSPSVAWFKDGQEISDNQNYKISTFARNDDFMDMTLRVKRIEKRQYGTYFCRAMNKLGGNETAITLVESVNIVCPPACGVGFRTSGAGKNLAGNQLIITIMTVFCLIFAALNSHSIQYS